MPIVPRCQREVQRLDAENFVTVFARRELSVVRVTDARADRASTGDESTADAVRSANVREGAGDDRRGREHAPNYVAFVAAKEGVLRVPFFGGSGFAVTSKRSGAVPT